jgi:hypothetical protein
MHGQKTSNYISFHTAVLMITCSLLVSVKHNCHYIDYLNNRVSICWPLEPKVAGSNPDEAVGFFRAKKSSARLLSEGE